MSNNVERARALLVAAIAATTTVVAGVAAGRAFGPAVSGAWATTSRPGEAPSHLLEGLVVLLSTTVLAGALLWIATSTVVCALDLLREGVPLPARSGAFRPRFVQALLAATLTSVVATGGHGAQAEEEPALPRALDGLTLPALPYGGVRTHLVRDGESLWSITADALGADPGADPGADRAAIGRGWPRLYRLNRARIGPDPGLIAVGTPLRLPPAFPAPTRGETR